MTGMCMWLLITLLILEPVRGRNLTVGMLEEYKRYFINKVGHCQPEDNRWCSENCSLASLQYCIVKGNIVTSLRVGVLARDHSCLDQIGQDCSLTYTSNFESISCNDNFSSPAVVTEDRWLIRDKFVLPEMTFDEEVINLVWVLTTGGIHISKGNPVVTTYDHRAPCHEHKNCSKDMVELPKVASEGGKFHDFICSAVLKVNTRDLNRTLNEFYNCKYNHVILIPSISFDFEDCNFRYIRLCQLNFCRSFGVTGKSIKAVLPLDMFLLSNRVKLEIWDHEQHYRSDTLYVGENSICDLVKCRFCLMKLRNPRCNDTFDIMLIWLFLVTSLFLVGYFIYRLHLSDKFLYVIAILARMTHKVPVKEEKMKKSHEIPLTEVGSPNEVNMRLNSEICEEVLQEAEEFARQLILSERKDIYLFQKELLEKTHLPVEVVEAVINEAIENQRAEVVLDELSRPDYGAGDSVRVSLTSGGRERASNRSLARVLASMTAFQLFVGGSKACTQLSYVSSNTKDCYYSSPSSMHCVYSTTVDLALVPVGQLSCLVFTDGLGDEIGTLEIEVGSLSFACNQRLRYFTSDVNVSCENVRNCYHAGNCYSRNCENVESDLSKEYPFQKSKDGLDYFYCKKVDVGLFKDGCVDIFSQGCSFLKQTLIPTGDKYEVFDCSDWTPEVKVKATMIGTGLSNQTKEILLTRFIPEFADNVLYSVLDFSHSIYNLDECFMENKSDGTISMIPCNNRGSYVRGTMGEFQCPSHSSIEHLPSICKSSKSLNRLIEGDGVTQCKSLYTSVRMSHAKHLIPLEKDGYMVKKIKNSIYLLAQDSSTISLRLKMNNLTVSTKVNDIRVNVEHIKISGCVNCEAGGVLKIRAAANHQHSLIYVICETLKISLVIGKVMEEYIKQIFMRDHPSSNACIVRAGQRAVSFPVEYNIFDTSSNFDNYDQTVVSNAVESGEGFSLKSFFQTGVIYFNGCIYYFTHLFSGALKVFYFTISLIIILIVLKVIGLARR